MADQRERFESIVTEAETLFAETLFKVFKCDCRGQFGQCSDCMNTGISASCQDEFDFATALHDLAAVGHRFMDDPNPYNTKKEG